MRECEACGGPITQGRCRECGAVDAHASASMSAPTPRRCPFDGADLHANGYCPTGDGYPITLKHSPDVCPQCGAPLAWSGDCYGCRLPDKPGPLYDHSPDGHWRVVTPNAQQIAPPGVAHDALRQITAILARFSKASTR